MTAQVVVGIDGGGTYTRAMVADTDGRVLAMVETAGSNPSHHPHAEENAGQAIMAAGCDPCQFGKMASLVTGAAAKGAPLACAVCDQAAAVLALGIGLVGACFSEKTVLLALVGSAVRAPAMRQALEQALSARANPSYRLVEPALSAVHGAVLMALERGGTHLHEGLVRGLAESPFAAAPRQAGSPASSAGGCLERE